MHFSTSTGPNGNRHPILILLAAFAFFSFLVSATPAPYAGGNTPPPKKPTTPELQETLKSNKDPNKDDMYWSKIGEGNAAKAANDRGAQTLEQQLGSQRDPANKNSPFHNAGPQQTKETWDSASKAFAKNTVASGKTAQAALHAPPNQNKDQPSVFQGKEEPILKGETGGGKVPAIQAHAPLAPNQAAANDPYQRWPNDQSKDWEKKHGPGGSGNPKRRRAIYADFQIRGTQYVRV